MNTSRTLLLIILCFAAGVGASLGWRMQRQVATVSAMRQNAESRSAPSEIKQREPKPEAAKEKQVFGRIESIDGLTKALATADAKGVDEWSKRLAKTDVFLACDMLAAAPKSSARDATLRRLIRQAAVADPFRAFAFLAKLGASGPEDDTRGFVITKMAEKDGKLAWDTLANATSLTNADVEKIASVWGKSQGYAAATFGLTLQNTIQRSQFLREAIAAWMAEDMASFAKWFAQQPADADLERFVEFDGFSDGRTSKPPSFEMLDAAMKLNVSVGSSSMYQMFQSAWKNAAMRDKAAEWIAAQKDLEVRDVAWKQLALEFAESDPARAREILPMISDPKLRGHASSALAAEMAKMTPREAMQFSTAIEDEAAREKSQASAMVTWAKTQPAESLAYLREHPEQLRPEYLSFASREWVKSDPVGAMETVDAFSAENARKGNLESLARDWYQRRPDQADAWLANAKPGAIKDAMQKAKAEPKKSNRLGAATWSGPDGEIHTNYGSPGQSTTTATVGGKTITYFY